MGFPNLFELLRRSDDPRYDRPRFQVGFAVDDIHEARRLLIERSVEAISEVDGGPESGGYWCYFRDPEETSSRSASAWATGGRTKNRDAVPRSPRLEGEGGVLAVLRAPRGR